ncbi:MAG: septum formation initiator family protein [Bacteroidota bacterium]|nr:septum formation initiator family protein [Bacteroidota bacterium]MEC7247365.1 septum formation initiator family protein [Bacteroidota bacterium]MEC7286989.1 septum formation initiator family protein [Bacteroidota bacterium]MEC7548602.1 septum formation initiator family protein [Bacteroidota bacterium]MEC7829864.1 septum formation initiator family protein [Bacteroidota bacterium]|tara:strand:- start:3128 stop:3436 length:309 start_codon:yes stop_codon:yes gene_type:complete
MKRKKNKILVYFRNIYAIIGLIFFIWMVFLDTNSLVKFIGLKKKLDRLENEKTKLEIEILKDKELIKKLNDSIEIEKYGREKYFLKKENEDVYIINYGDSLK